MGQPATAQCWQYCQSHQQGSTNGDGNGQGQVGKKLPFNVLEKQDRQKYGDSRCRGCQQGALNLASASQRRLTRDFALLP